jgi:hypothetical protein
VCSWRSTNRPRSGHTGVGRSFSGKVDRRRAVPVHEEIGGGSDGLDEQGGGGRESRKLGGRRRRAASPELEEKGAGVYMLSPIRTLSPSSSPYSYPTKRGGGVQGARGRQGTDAGVERELAANRERARGLAGSSPASGYRREDGDPPEAMVGAVWLRLCGPGLTSARAFSFQTTEPLFHFAVATFVISTDNQGQ